MPLSPTATRDLLAKLGHQPQRFLGQNFLIDGNIVRKSLELAEVVAGDRVVEIGPGLGTLTSALLESGAEVWAVEKDPKLHAHLVTTLLPRFPERFHLVHGDAVELPLAGMAPAMAAKGFKVVANLPYAIATPWLDAVLSGPLPARLVLMLQQEAAQRYTAQPGTKSFGAISIFLQAAYAIAPGHKVAGSCFFPKPDVESHLLNLVRRPTPHVFSNPVKRLVRGIFQQRRKQIGSLLRARLTPNSELQTSSGQPRTRNPEPKTSLAVSPWQELLRTHGLSEKTRPEAIPVDWWVEFSNLLPPLT